MKRFYFLLLAVMPGIFLCSCEPEVTPPDPVPSSTQDVYLPYVGTWQGIVIEKCGKDLIPGDTAIDLFLKRSTPADLRTYGTIAQGPNYYESTSQTEGPMLWQITFHVNPHQLLITRLSDGSLYRYYDIIMFEDDILKLENEDRYEFWCRY